MIDPIVIDFETKPIISGSGRAPVPVGVSILVPEQVNTYLAWGHPGANNSTYEHAREALARCWDLPLLFHNCKFDIGVALEHFGLPWPKQYDDTMFSLFLLDPLATDLGLKPSAERLLGMRPEERDNVYEWLKANFKGPFISDHKMVTKKNAGAYISYAPWDVVAPYAMGDTARTLALHRYCMPLIERQGMRGAYDREIKIARVGYWMEREGVRVDREKLGEDYAKYSAIKEAQEDIIRHHLGDIDVDKPKEVASAILNFGYAESLPTTPTGRLSTAKSAFEEHVTDPGLKRALRYRGALKTLVGTFFHGWIELSTHDGYLHPSWNQVRNPEGFGARTGRFSCSEPNLTNVPTEFEEAGLKGLDLPFMRQYILPDDGCVIMPADYNGQEMRILAHYAEGKALSVYQDDPMADFHQVAAALIKKHAKLDVSRKMCKIVGFSLIYGSGVAKLAAQLGVSEDDARLIKNAYFKAIDGLREFIGLFKNRSSVKTWGGRILPCEAPHEVDGEWREFYYRLVNYLIQGSAADQSKEAMLAYDAGKRNGRLLMMVHDELVINVPKGDQHNEARILRASMEEMPGWDVPFKVQIETGLNWHDLKAFS